MVRFYEHTDAAALAALHNAFQPDEQRTAVSFQQRIARLKQAGGNAWVVEENGEVAGYAAVAPLPGLEGIVDLEGFVGPAWQRRGLGSRLLTYLLRELEHTGVRQLSYCVTAPDAPAAHFLRRHGFAVEHEEWDMVLPDLAQLPPLSLPAGCRLETFSRTKAIRYFCTLYDESFSIYRWYQPYSHAEVAAALSDAANILFLTYDGRPVGFVWLHLTEADAGEIEPIGVIRSYQGRGYGRLLLVAGLHHLARRGAKQVAIGLWAENQVALHLYQSLGFQHRYTRTYLGYNLQVNE